MHAFAGVVAALVGLASVVSGPQKGDPLPEAKAKGQYEPIEAKEFSLLDKAKTEPSLLVFVQKLTRPTFRLIRKLDEFAAENATLNAQFVWVSDDLEKTEEFLKRAKPSLAMRSPVSVAIDKNGPASYGFNDQAGITILVVEKGVVTANFAFADPNETDARPILETVRKTLAKK